MDKTIETVAVSPPKLEIKTVLKALIHVGGIVGILLLSAGRVDWSAAWALAGIFLVYDVIMLSWPAVDSKIAAVLEDQRKPAPKPQPQGKVLLLLYPVLLLAVLVTSGLDGGRFHWSSMSPMMRALGAVAVVIGHGAFLWCLSANSEALHDAVLRHDRNGMLMETGPYRYIRHPFYLATFLVALGGAVLLGSWWAAIPAGLILPLYMARTVFEERMLVNELEGYREYTSRVRYRWFPGIW
ncbi:MAG TPA: isoprenylcysteine carboxylmethyltransferase family protein [Candidatus Angelobacter sp.]|nr:isoprenylcysteine carboxylmethyltransferase family protein [Candidatus Angelobacter sp.]